MAASLTIPVYRHEKSLFVLMFLISAFLWFVFLLASFGMALLIIPFIFIAYLFAQSAFISYIKGTGAQVSPEQFPELHARIVACAEKLRMRKVPDAYIIHADGRFNALATRFLGRNFIVLFSDVVDALSDNPDAINFYIGHELAHIKQGHLGWGPFLWPAGLLPLIGAAYSRACESTCDLQGAFCCENTDDAKQGLAALAVGSEKWKTINMASYEKQTVNTRGFWMSFHELTGDYPWLVKRMMRLDGKSTDIPSRNPVAWLFALFVPRMGFAGLYVVAMIGVLAAVAIPAYQDYTARAQVSSGFSDVSKAKTCVEDFYYRNQAVPVTNEECGLPLPAELAQGKYIESIAIDNGLVVLTMAQSGVQNNIAGETVVFEPRLDEQDSIFWLCSGGTVEMKYRPSQCKQ